MKRKSGKTFKLFRTRSTMLILVVLFLSLCVAVGVVEIIVKMATDGLEKQADKVAELQAQSIGRVVETSFASATWVANSFLAAMMHVEYVPNEHNSMVNTLHVLRDSECEDLNVDKLYQSLADFLEVNPDFFAAALIFEPGVIKDAPKQGIAALVRKGNKARINLLDSVDVFNHPLYTYAHHNTYGYISEIKRLETCGMQLITYVAPILDENGNLIGEFWMDCPQQRFSELMKSQKTELNAVSLILDRNLMVIGASDTSVYEEKFDNYVARLLGDDYNSGKLESIRRHVLQNEQFKCKKQIQGENYYCYFYPLKTTDYTLLISISERRIRHIVNDFKGLLFSISMSGLFFVLLCSGFAFHIYRKKEGEALRMQGELDIASKIQQNFLPAVNMSHEKTDIFAYQRSARQVGGDLYDYVERDNKLFFCVGDVSGKGVPASLFMAIASSHFRSICRYEDAPALIASHLNRCLADRNHSEMFCTMFLGVLDLKSGILNYCNAGHNPPVLKTENGSAFLDVKRNMMLGAFDHYNYEQQSLQMNVGDMLFVYTDGVTEAFAADGTLYGDDRLQDLLRSLPDQATAEQVCQQVLDSVSAFAQGTEQSDDITMLCMKTV